MQLFGEMRHDMAYAMHLVTFYVLTYVYLHTSSAQIRLLQPRNPHVHLLLRPTSSSNQQTWTELTGGHSRKGRVSLGAC